MLRKYKINYIQNAGNIHDTSNNFYLPCEITHYTSKVYFNERDKITEKITEKIGKSNKTTFTGVGYYQDPYIQLYNGIIYKNIYNTDVVSFFDFNNIGEESDFKNDEHIKVEPLNSSATDQNKGGNFISAPDSTIFYIEGISSNLLSELKTNTTNNIVELKCGFRVFPNHQTSGLDGFRHVDEIMCFMPYGIQGYKIWFYDEFDEMCFNSLLDYLPDIKPIVDQNKKLFVSGKITNQEKIRLNKEAIKCKIIVLNIERLANLEKISIALFAKPYSECTDKFVFFKYYAFLPSIFNRTWVETKDSITCLFPEINQNIKYQIEINQIKTKVMEEMEKIHSIIVPANNNIQSTKPVQYFFIPVIAANELAPEGTIHCLIKQRFIKPDKYFM